MSKERLEEASEWLRSMYDLLSLKTDEEDRAYTQKRIDLFEWMIEQINRLDGGETFKGYIEINEVQEQQNKRYREAIEYVMTAKSTHYSSLENALEDIKYVINEVLERDSE